MITPLWTDPRSHPLSGDIRTRFTLSYADTSETFIHKLVKEFEAQKAEVLFALRNLVKIVISLEYASDQNHKAIFEKEFNESGDHIEIIQRHSHEKSVRRQKYRIARHIVDDMPEDDRRQHSSSVVQIGFPVKNKMRSPTIVPNYQNVFAYLPITQIPEIPFLVQADFVLSASRQAISEENEWNQELLSGIACAFFEEIKRMCREPTLLRYTWMRFLPPPDILGFFSDLHNLIRRLLSKTKLIETRKAARLAKISELRIVPDDFLHDGSPLFEDLEDKDVYIATEYEKKDYSKLQMLGLKELSEAEILVRVNESQLQGTSLDDDWHTSFINFAEGFKEDEDAWSYLGYCKTIPVMRGKQLSWVSESSLSKTPVYLPYAVGEDSVHILIPGDLNLSILHPIAYAVGDRLAFYQNLGISDCDDSVIVGAIIRRHKKEKNISFTNIVAHLEILFWFNVESSRLVQGKVRAINVAGNLSSPALLYLRSESPFSAEKLLRHTEQSKVNEWLIRPQFQRSPVKSYIRNGRTWKRWLTECLGIREFPQLQDPFDADKLDAIVYQIAEDNPTELLSLLRERWQVEYATVCQENPQIQSEIAKLKFFVRSGASQEVLATTYLPTEDIIDAASECGVSDRVPFLQLLPRDENKSQFSIDEWSFLENFGVTCHVDLNLFLGLLSNVRNAEIEATPVMLKELYAKIGDFAKRGDESVVKALLLQQLPCSLS